MAEPDKRHEWPHWLNVVAGIVLAAWLCGCVAGCLVQAWRLCQ